MEPNQSDIENLLHESRRFPPSLDFASRAIAKPEIYDEAGTDRLEFWADRARELHWHQPFTKTLDYSNPPFAKWFEDGRINVCYNALDRHVVAGKGDKVALYIEGESGDRLEISYAELLT